MDFIKLMQQIDDLFYELFAILVFFSEDRLAHADKAATDDGPRRY